MCSLRALRAESARVGAIHQDDDSEVFHIQPGTLWTRRDGRYADRMPVVVAAVRHRRLDRASVYWISVRKLGHGAPQGAPIAYFCKHFRPYTATETTSGGSL